MKRKVNQIKIGIILSYVSLLVSNGVSILYTPVMIRLLGQSEYGLYNLVSSFVAYLGLMSFGFDNTYLRYYTQYKHTKTKQDVASLNGMFLTVFCGIAAVASICGAVMCYYSDFIFGSKLTPDELATAKILMSLLVINLAIAFPANLFKTYINANEKFFFAKMLNMIKTVINPFIMLPLLLAGYKSVAMVSVTLVYSIVIESINVWYCFKKLNMSISFRNFEFKLLKNIAGFSFFVFLGEIVDEINWNVDKYILGRFSGTVAVAVYGVAAQLSSYFRQFSIYISSVFAPRVNKIVAIDDDNEKITGLMIKIGRIQFIVLSLVATGFIFAGRMFCNLWAGSNYDDSYLIAVVLMVPSIIPLIQNVGISVLTARNKHRFRSVIYFLIALVNVIISIPLCIRLEGLGSAIGTAISLIIGNGIIINLYYVHLGLDMKKFWKSIGCLSRGLIVPVIFGTVSLLMKLPYKWSVLFILIVCYMGIYMGSMYKIGFNEYEKNMLREGFAKLKKLVKNITRGTINTIR